MPLALFNDALDDLPAVAQVNGFVGADLATKPDALPPELIANGENVFADETAHLVTRPGLRLAALCHAELSEGGDTAVQGMAYYDTPQIERALVARDGKLFEVYGDQPAATVGTITLAEPLPVSGLVVFAQLVDRMFYVAATAHLRWSRYDSGSWSSGVVTAFANANAMPAWGGIVAHGLRLFAWPADGSRLYASAIGEANAAANWTQTDNLRFGIGEGDPIVACVSAQSGNLIVLTQTAAYAVDTRAPSVVDWTVTAITRLAGCAAAQSALAVGQDVLFLGRYGVLSLGALVAADSLNPAAAVSAPMQPLIDRINWARRDRIHATLWRDIYLLALPLDDDERPSVWIGYNVRTRRWAAPWRAAPAGLVLGETGQTILVTEDGSLLVDQTPAVFLEDGAAPDPEFLALWSEGWCAACVSRFDGRQETLVADGIGRVFRFDPGYDKDDASEHNAQEITSWATLKSFDFDAPENPKQPFWMDAQFYGSTAAGVSLLFVPDEELAFPEVPLVDGQRIVGDITTGITGGFPITFPIQFRPNRTNRHQRHLRGLPRFRAAALQVHAARGRLRLRGVRLSAFLDTPELSAT